MINADILIFQEFMKREPLPLSKIQTAVLEFMQGRKDIVLFGSQAVNAYVSEPRMTQDVDLLSNCPEEVSEELRKYLSAKFHISVRVRKIGKKGFRVYQIRKEGNRHLADVRLVDELPNVKLIENIQILSPAELVASKIISYQSRYGKPKSWTDRRDLAVLLLEFPELKTQAGKVFEILRARKANSKILNAWRKIVEEDLQVGK